MYTKGLVEGLKGLMRRGEITVAKAHEPSFQGKANVGKPPFSPSVGAKPPGLTAHTPRAKAKLANSLKRAKVTGNNPTIRGDVGNQADLKANLAQFRPGSVDHQIRYDPIKGRVSTRGEKKVRGAKETWHQQQNRNRRRTGEVAAKLSNRSVQARIRKQIAKRQAQVTRN